MIESIALMSFFLYLIILIIICWKGFVFSTEYADYHSGQIVVSIVVIYIVSAIVSFLAIIYAPYKLGINIYFTEYHQFETGLLLVISSMIAYFVSSKFLKKCIHFFMKEGDLVRKKK